MLRLPGRQPATLSRQQGARPNTQLRKRVVTIAWHTSGAMTMATLPLSAHDYRRSAAARPTLGGAAWARELLQRWLLFPALGTLSRLEIIGAARLTDLTGPLLIAPNHTSHLDILAVLAALPPARRQRTAVAAAADYFFSTPARAMIARLLVNAFPFQRQGRAAASLRLCQSLTAEGWSLVLFPEGTRSIDGQIGPFRPGIGRLATRVGLPVVPVYLAGLAAILPKGRCLPRPGRARVVIGQPLHLDPALSAAAATAIVETAVRDLAEKRRP